MIEVTIRAPIIVSYPFALAMANYERKVEVARSAARHDLATAALEATAAVVFALAGYGLIAAVWGLLAGLTAATAHGQYSIAKLLAVHAMREDTMRGYQQPQERLTP